MNERVRVVVCNYNKADDVVMCIQSVLKNNYTDLHIYVVDNASKDESVKRVEFLDEDLESGMAAAKIYSFNQC